MASVISTKRVSVSFVTFKPEDKILFLGMKEGDTLVVPPEITVKTVTGLLHKELQSETVGYYDSIVSVTNVPPPPALMELILKILKDGGLFIIECPNVTEMKKTLLYNGFVDLHCHSISEDRSQWECKKPEETGPVKLSFGAVKLPTDDIKGIGEWSFADGADDTIDEAGLLDDEIDPVLMSGPAIKTKSDCEVGASRKPCANCTCGRAEEYAAEKSDAASTAKSSEHKSACGKCHLGDAFRCASCPYLGKPAFDPATGPDGPVKLDLSFADTDL